MTTTIKDSRRVRGQAKRVVLAAALVAGSAGASAQVTYFHNDTGGSPIAASDESGALVWKESYRPYGDRMLKPATANTQWFHGKQQDPDTGLEDFGARNYHPVLGRFLSIDPVDFTADNLHSFNRYAYGNNNPLRYKDPDGNFALSLEVCLGFCLGGTVGINWSTTEFAATASAGAGIGGGIGFDFRPDENGAATNENGARASQGFIVNGYGKAGVEASGLLGGIAYGGKVTGGYDFGTGKGVGGLQKETGLVGPGQLEAKATFSGGFEATGYVNLKDKAKQVSNTLKAGADKFKKDVIDPAMKAMQPKLEPEW